MSALHNALSLDFQIQVRGSSPESFGYKSAQAGPVGVVAQEWKNVFEGNRVVFTDPWLLQTFKANKLTKETPFFTVLRCCKSEKFLQKCADKTKNLQHHCTQFTDLVVYVTKFGVDSILAAGQRMFKAVKSTQSAEIF